MSHAPRPQQRRPFLSVTGFIQLVVLLVVGLCVGRFFPADPRPLPAPNTPVTSDAPAAPAAPTSAAGHEGPARPERSVEQATVEGIRKQQLASARIQRQRVLFLAAEVGRAVDACQAEIDGFRKTTEALLADEIGKQLASSPDLVKQFRAVTEQSLPGPAIAADSRAVLSDLKARLDAAQEDPVDASSTPPALISSLRTMRKEARDAKAAYERTNAELQSIIAEARASGGVATITLREAVQKLKQDEARARATLIAASVDEAKKQIDHAIAEEHASQGATEKALELRRTQAMTTLQRKADEARLAEEAQAAELATQRAYLRSIEGRQQVQSYLQPFVAPGFGQPHGYTVRNLSFETTSQKGPVSLGRLRQIGALKDDMEGISMLAAAANNFHNDRPKWAVRSYITVDPPANWSAAERQLAKRAQELLRTYGDALVEEGLLAR